MLDCAQLSKDWPNIISERDRSLNKETTVLPQNTTLSLPRTIIYESRACHAHPCIYSNRKKKQGELRLYISITSCNIRRP